MSAGNPRLRLTVDAEQPGLECVVHAKRDLRAPEEGVTLLLGELVHHRAELSCEGVGVNG